MNTDARLWPSWVVLFALLAGTVFAVVMPAGLPYDEPSHWSTVQYIATHWTLPVMGDPGVTYEGQQAPLYYLMAAPLSLLPNGFLMVRLFGVVGHGVVVLLTWLLIRRAVPSIPAVALAGAGFVALNPVLLAIAGSVQNDTWALAWGVAALLSAATLTAEHPSPRDAIVVGVVVGLMLLTKLSMLPVAVGIVILLLIRRLFGAAGWLVLSATLVSGWWFVRNVLLYGDLSGQSAVARTGVSFPHTELSARYIAQSVLAYLTVPTEYVRNIVSAPPVVDVAALMLGVAIALGAALLGLRLRKQVDGQLTGLVAGVGFLAVAAWLGQILIAQPVSFRAALGVWPLVAVCAGSVKTVSSRWYGWAAVGVVAAVQIAIMVWFLISIAGQPTML